MGHGWGGVGGGGRISWHIDFRDTGAVSWHIDFRDTGAISIGTKCMLLHYV